MDFWEISEVDQGQGVDSIDVITLVQTKDY